MSNDFLLNRTHVTHQTIAKIDMEDRKVDVFMPKKKKIETKHWKRTAKL